MHSADNYGVYGTFKVKLVIYSDPKLITEFFGLLITPLILLIDMLRFSEMAFSLKCANFRSYHLSESNQLEFSVLLKEL